MKDKKIQEKVNVHLKLKNNKKVQKLKEKGITLIALVVTIIILLILVGVTISQISGENGLIRRAKEAAERYKNASEQEQIQLGKVNAYEVLGENEGENKKLLEAEDTDVLEGKTYIGKNGDSIGSMADYSNQTVDAGEVSNDGTYATLTIPQNGYYNTGSKIKTSLNNLNISDSFQNYFSKAGTSKSFPYTATKDCLAIVTLSMYTDNYSNNTVNYYLYVKDETTGRNLTTLNGIREGTNILLEGFRFENGHRYSAGYIVTGHSGSEGDSWDNMSYNYKLVILDL